MPARVFMNGRAITYNCIRNYVVAEQWLSTYRISNNPRHLETACACYAIADDLYSQSFDHVQERDEALMLRIRTESRKLINESLAALAHTSRVFDGRDQTGAAALPDPDRHDSLGQRPGCRKAFPASPRHAGHPDTGLLPEDDPGYRESMR
ncbi:hypothetical protein [Rhodopila globiformis]|uniref:hypothetical protein n=1 Tax=Rhodopila globiformis TaxID=1071 RepID=UPI0011B04090|nr:hypothetical protein [Rhodopila globiformis]